MILLIISALLSTAVFFAPARISRAYVFWIIPINVLADSMIGFFGEGETHTGIIRAGLIYPYLILSLLRLKPLRDHLILFGFIGYLLALVLVSSDIQYSLWQLMKVSSGFLFYPLAFVYVKELNDFRRLSWSVLIGGVLIVVNFIIAQIFQIGESPYIGGRIYIGAGLVQITYVISYLALLSPLLLEARLKLPKPFVYAVVSLGIIVTILTFRRSSILAIILGGLTLGFTTKFKAQLMRISLVAAVVVGLGYMKYSDTIDTLLERRLNIERELTSRGGRVAEFQIVAEPFVKGDIKRMLIGTEVFNSINLRDAERRDGSKRPLHVDYGVILHGAGLIGLFLYLFYHLRIWYFNKKLSAQLSHLPEFKNYGGVFMGVMVGHLVISASYQLPVITSLTTLFFILGGLNSLRYNTLLQLSTPLKE